MDFFDILLLFDLGVGLVWSSIKLLGFGYVYCLKDCLYSCGLFKGFWGLNVLYSIFLVLVGWLDFLFFLL